MKFSPWIKYILILLAGVLSQEGSSSGVYQPNPNLRLGPTEASVAPPPTSAPSRQPASVEDPLPERAPSSRTLRTKRPSSRSADAYTKPRSPRQGEEEEYSIYEDDYIEQ